MASREVYLLGPGNKQCWCIKLIPISNSRMSDSDDESVEYEDENIVLGPIKLVVTTVAFLPIHKLMKLQTDGCEISGQKVWCGSLSVTEFILNHRDFCSGHQMLELGAGTGILGMVCAKLGAAKVQLTDFDTRSLTHMKQDLLKNEICGTVCNLDWFSPDYDSIFQKFDVSDLPIRIVAGDVLYKEMLLNPFFSVVKQILSHYARAVVVPPPLGESGTSTTEYHTNLFPCPLLLLCHVPRAGVDQCHVVATAKAHGLHVHTVDESHWQKGVCTAGCPADDYTRAKVYIMTLSDQA